LFQLRLAALSAPIAYADLARALGVEPGQRVPLEDARQAVLAQRRQRGMVLDAADHDTWSCGSFFTNPVMSTGSYAALQDRAQVRLGAIDGPVRVPRWDTSDGQVKTSAAWLIDNAGFGKGYRMPGPAALSTKHTLAVTNRGSATAADVLALAREIREGVHDAFGVSLVNEPVIVGATL
jgi:UDP-N-acetylmuramate dehydrogenase